MDIIREIVMRAPRAKVWNALTTQEGWTAWFSTQVEGVFAPGEHVKLGFGEGCICTVIIQDLTPQSLFSYRWHPGDDCAIDAYPADEMTLVEFRLSDHPDGTLLNLVESGFERIPEEKRAKCLRLNNEGWDSELAELVAWVEEGRKQD